ncbi:serine/threonine-protein phosphatase 7 long form homolog [Gossypium raimondii]|uniref:serine/threonine-protein phosphatase 7 long form homolog n=1 Tax=Gossypium raimondii TaxID=29730 RepID=UPI00227A42C0|nr:serine/threonine-protein phosphatase 7 long form homolog [Gossypium raimondii]
MKMFVDRILEFYIRNIHGPPSPLVENYLREASFWHVATVGRGYKLDPKLISTLIERWRPETHTFHLPCGERTITLKDVNLQLGLPVDGYPITRSVQSGDWGAVGYVLLGAISEKINGGRIEMGWLRDTFPESDDDSTEVERIRYDWAYILHIIRGYLMPDLSRNLVHLRWLLKLVDFRAAGELCWGSAVLATLYREMCGATRPSKAKIRGCLSLLQPWARFCFPFVRPRVDHPYTFPLITRWNHPTSYARLPTSLEDIQLLLDQQSEAHFQWTPYEDPAIRAVIPDEFFQNRNAWHAKVALISYATVEMHQSDRMLPQFECRQPIPVAPEVLDDHHKIDLRQLHTDWPRFWSYYIQMWEDRYDYMHILEPNIVPELACVPEYMPWFRIHGKSYLLLVEERQRQLRVQRERRGPLNPRRRDDDTSISTRPKHSPGPSSAVVQSPGPARAPT